MSWNADPDSYYFIIAAKKSDHKERVQFSAIFDNLRGERGELLGPTEHPPGRDTRQARFRGFFGIRSVLGITCMPWLQPRFFAIPVEPSLWHLLGTLQHRTRSKHYKSILQRGLIGGAFGQTSCPYLQLSPFYTWDSDRNLLMAVTAGTMT